MFADIITIGDEILIGQIVDTNSAYIASKLNQIGFQVRRIISVSDTREAIFGALDESLPKTDLVVMTGGLGPTNDDITKKTLREYFGGEYQVDPEAMRYIEELCKQRGLTLSDRNRFQAMVPDTCTTLRNRSGSAPGMLFRKDSAILVSLPGVSFEMKDILDNELIPLLIRELRLPVRLQKTILTCGIAESAAADKLSDFEDKLPENAGFAYLPAPGILRLRISVSGTDKIQLKKQLNELVGEVDQIMGAKRIFGYDEDTLPAAIGRLLKENEFTLAMAESCTGGTLAGMITSVPGASDYFKGSVTAYSNAIKEKVLGVDPVAIQTEGAVSRPVVEQMASGVRTLMGADFSLATSGIAGPGGGSAEKPVGTTWIAIATPSGIYSHCFHFGDNRERNILRASVTALNLLRNIIREYRQNSR